MSHGGVGGDNQIAVGDDRSGVQKVPGFIDLLLAADKTVFEGAGLQLLTAKPFLE